jgi:hypothetical protein
LETSQLLTKEMLEETLGSAQQQQVEVETAEVEAET